jgi:hypothetical protein
MTINCMYVCVCIMYVCVCVCVCMCVCMVSDALFLDKNFLHDL